jgi:hypothetical protein
MKINDKCSLVLNHLYFYDFKSCYPTLLKNIGYEFESDLNNKLERNIEIGLLQKENRQVYEFLSTSADSLISYYLEENNVSEKNIILTQKDGFIIKEEIKNSSDFMKLDLREIIDTMIITPDRKKYIWWNENKMDVKGVVNFYSGLLEVFNLFKKMTFCNKQMLFKQMEYIKKYMFEQTGKEFFVIDKDGVKIIQTNAGPVKINSLDSFAIENVNKKKYFDHYFKEFLDAIYLTYYGG